jgi:imidazolonepropionase-like amidohydrolase
VERVIRTCGAIGLALALVAAVAPPRLSSAQGSMVALTGARVIDGTGRPALDHATVIVVNGRIQDVGAGLAVPPGALRVDVGGKTIVPGFVNAHGHVDAAPDSSDIRDQLLLQLRTYAQYGVTTVYNLGSGPSDTAEGLRLRDEQDRGPLDRARHYSSGVVVADRTPDDARKNVDRHADDKVDIIKIRVDGVDSSPEKMTPDVYRAVIDQAHKRDLRVAAHLFYLKDALSLLDAGADVIAHSVRDQDVTPAFIDGLKRRQIGYIPTLTRELSVFVYESTPSFFSDPFFLRGRALYSRQMQLLSDPARQAKTKASPDAQAMKQALDQASRNLKRLAAAGVTIAMGTDSGANLMGRWQGYFEHVEMEMMVKAGLTPLQAITAATGNAARVMKLESLGTLERGKRADFVVLDGNPLADIVNTRRIDSVWIAGRRLESQAPAH